MAPTHRTFHADTRLQTPPERNAIPSGAGGQRGPGQRLRVLCARECPKPGHIADLLVGTAADLSACELIVLGHGIAPYRSWCESLLSSAVVLDLAAAPGPSTAARVIRIV